MGINRNEITQDAFSRVSNVSIFCKNPTTGCKLFGAVDTTRYPRVENRVWSDQENHQEKGSKDRAGSTCRTHSDSFNDTSRRGVAIVPPTISRYLAEANLKSKRPFRALPLTPEHRQLRL
ncbi:HTH_Tnp_Tc3_2 domain-containing protein [Trichonephila clavipes]|uniref:HTH_Tnp_Tc3_2 domain-containing protein n=1 Tax=Trichonephila clavipes TaxID=2585209 RepID=A0A8X6UTG8_TRICX|nr:HTH_Tnp_Tc3_2 domain-containing protein [Trichonephila clavipes]